MPARLWDRPALSLNTRSPRCPILRRRHHPGLRQQPRRYAPPPVGRSVHAICFSSSVIPVRFAFEASSGSVYSKTLGHGLKRSLPVMGARRAGTLMLPYTLTVVATVP